MNRNSFLRSSLFAGFASVFFKNKAIAEAYQPNFNYLNRNNILNATVHTLPNLAFKTDALEPNIDKMTMEIHHDRHHKAYVDNLNKALPGSAFEKMSLAEMFKNVKKLPAAIRNNAGGHWNHSFFWQCLAPATGNGPTGALEQAITSKWGSVDKFKEEFAKAATGRFGSGWAWLVVGKNKALAIGSTPNQDNPLMGKAVDINGAPILGLDVWEHAYYLKYQNKRADYIKAYWNVVNWPQIEKWYAEAVS